MDLSWTVKKAECRRIDAFELWCWRRLLRVPWTARRSNQSILKEINPVCSPPSGATLHPSLSWIVKQGIRTCWLEGGMTSHVKQESCHVPWGNHKLAGNCSHFYWDEVLILIPWEGKIHAKAVRFPFQFLLRQSQTHLPRNLICPGLDFTHALKQLSIWSLLGPRKSHGQRSLVGCSPWDREDSDMTE